MTLPVAEQQKQHIIKTIRDYGKQLFLFIRGKVKSREDAEDILQDVWYQFSNIVSSEPIEQTGAWLFRVARNRIIDQYRKKQPDLMPGKQTTPEAESEFLFGEFVMSTYATPETEMLKNLFWEELQTALDELPEEQRIVFVMNELEGISFQEIADTTGEKINTLISRKRYAVLHLRKRLEILYKEITEQ